MLGRTDSAAPPAAPASSSSGRLERHGSCAWPTGRSTSASSWPRWPRARRRCAPDGARPAGHDLRPDRHGRAGRDDRPLPARRRLRDQLTDRSPAGALRRRARRLPRRSTTAAKALARAHPAGHRPLRRARPRTSTRTSPTEIAGVPRPTATLADGHARARAGPGLPAGRRRPAHDRSPPSCSASSTRAGKGQYGLEQATTTSLLAGEPKTSSPDRRRLQDRSPARPGSSTPARPAPDIRTTIDAGLQLQLEQEVFCGLDGGPAKSVSAVVMDPEDRRDPGRGELPLLRRQRLLAGRRQGPRPASSTRSSARSTSRARSSRC